MIFGIYIITKILFYFQDHIEILLDSNLVEEIRGGIFNQIINKYKNNYEEIPVGKIITYLNIIPHMYQDLIFRFMVDILPYLGAIMILLIYYFTIDKKIGLTILAYLIIVGVIIYHMGKICIKYNLYKYEKYYKINEEVQDKLSNIFSILVNNTNNNEISDNIKREKEFKNINKKSHFTNLKLNTFLNIITIFFFCLIMYIYVCIFKKIKNSDRSKIITSFLVWFYMISYIDKVRWYLVDFFNLKGIIDNYNKMLEIEYNKQSTGLVNCIKNGEIIFKNVSFSYDNKNKVLNKVNIHFYPNKINTIFGESGRGKSTILRLILRLLKSQEGKITIDNIDLNSINIKYLRDNISIVNQDIKLFNDSIYNNIKYGNNKSNQEILELVNKLDLFNTIFKNLPDKLETKSGTASSNLSGGQRQIILILRSYLDNKKIFVLDEPTTGLDKNTKKLVLNIIKKISRNKTIIIVTHDNDIKKISDKIYNL